MAELESCLSKTVHEQATLEDNDRDDGYITTNDICQVSPIVVEKAMDGIQYDVDDEKITNILDEGTTSFPSSANPVVVSQRIIHHDKVAPHSRFGIQNRFINVQHEKEEYDYQSNQEQNVLNDSLFTPSAPPAPSNISMAYEISYEDVERHDVTLKNDCDDNDDDDDDDDDNDFGRNIKYQENEDHSYLNEKRKNNDHVNEIKGTTTTTTDLLQKHQDIYETQENISIVKEDIESCVTPPNGFKHIIVDESNRAEEYKCGDTTFKQLDGEISADIYPSLIEHKIQEDDTLFSISIAYGVQLESIQLANNMISDFEFYRLDHDTLLIPSPTIIPTKRVAIVPADIAEKKKEFAIRIFMKFKGTNRDEANYYLSLHEFDFKRAFFEYEEDIAWEAAQHKKNKKKERKKFIRKIRKSSLVQGFAYFFGACFPSLKQLYKDPYEDVELDQIIDDDDNDDDGRG